MFHVVKVKDYLNSHVRFISSVTCHMVVCWEGLFCKRVSRHFGWGDLSVTDKQLTCVLCEDQTVGE